MDMPCGKTNTGDLMRSRRPQQHGLGKCSSEEAAPHIKLSLNGLNIGDKSESTTHLVWS